MYCQPLANGITSSIQLLMLVTSKKRKLNVNAFKLVFTFCCTVLHAVSCSRSRVNWSLANAMFTSVWYWTIRLRQPLSNNRPTSPLRRQEDTVTRFIVSASRLNLPTGLAKLRRLWRGTRWIHESEMDVVWMRVYAATHARVSAWPAARHKDAARQMSAEKTKTINEQPRTNMCEGKRCTR